MGYSTSSIIKIHTRKFLEENNINATLQTSSLAAIKNYLKKADLIITSLGMNPEEYSIPVINAVELISGRNKDGVLNEILKTLNEIDSAE